MPVSEQTFKQVALEDPEGHWEWICGYMYRKPDMTAKHNDMMTYLGIALGSQLDRSRFRVRINAGHISRPAESYFIPDVSVIPIELFRRMLETPDELETYTQALPLVVEVWSRSTGAYDLRTKLTEYQRRGDREIWLIHPYERTLTAWRRQPDGSYAETVYHSGIVQPVALPNVSIDFDTLFSE